MDGAYNGRSQKILVRTFLTGCLRLCHKTGNFYHRRVYIHRKQLLVQLLTEYGRMRWRNGMTGKLNNSASLLYR